MQCILYLLSPDYYLIIVSVVCVVQRLCPVHLTCCHLFSLPPVETAVWPDSTGCEAKIIGPLHLLQASSAWGENGRGIKINSGSVCREPQWALQYWGHMNEKAVLLMRWRSGRGTVTIPRFSVPHQNNINSVRRAAGSCSNKQNLSYSRAPDLFGEYIDKCSAQSGIIEPF